MSALACGGWALTVGFRPGVLTSPRGLLVLPCRVLAFQVEQMLLPPQARSRSRPRGVRVSLGSVADEGKKGVDGATGRAETGA